MTTTDRRAALRAGAGLVAGGVFVASCSGRGDPGRAEPSRAAPGTTPSRAPARTLTAVPTPRAFPREPAQIATGPRTHSQVALTFHGAGDPGIAKSVLGEVERAGARVTVLAVGAWLDEHPEMARRVLDGGHDLGNHTQRHLGINDMPEAEARAEIGACAERLKRLTGGIGNWFRPSRAARASPLVVRLAREAGYPHVLSYDVDPLDFTSPGADQIARAVLGDARAGSVVSLHFGYRDTVAALPVVLEELGRRGLRAVTTTELLS